MENLHILKKELKALYKEISKYSLNKIISLDEISSLSCFL